MAGNNQHRDRREDHWWPSRQAIAAQLPALATFGLAAFWFAADVDKRLTVIEKEPKVAVEVVADIKTEIALLRKSDTDRAESLARIERKIDQYLGRDLANRM